MLRKQEASAMTFINDILWRVIRTKPFDTVRPKIIRAHSYRLEGQIHHSKSNFSAIMLGQKETVAFFSKLVYATKPTIRFLGKRTFSNIASSAEKLKVDSTVIETSWFFSRFLHDNGFFTSPRIDFVLDINDSLENIQKRMAEGKRRRIRKLVKDGFTFEITKDPVKVKSFYNEIYLPHMLKRHGESAIPISFSEYTQLLLSGYLMLIKKGPEYVSGNLLLSQGNGLRTFITGVKNVDSELTGGSLAAYYYAIVNGIQKGCAIMDFGETSSFMLDGNFQYKRELGAHVRPVTGPSAYVFGIRFSKASEPVMDFLSANPFVFLDGANLSGLIYLESISDLHESCCVPGLSSLYIVSSNLDCSNQQGLKLQKLSAKNFSNQNTSALRVFNEACNVSGYSLYRLLL